MRRRIGALALMLLLCLSALVGCTSAKTKQERRVIGTCAGYDVRYEELRYLTLTYKDLFEETYGEGIWEDPVTAEKYRVELEETVWDLLLNNYAVLATCDQYLPKKNAIEDEAITEAVDGMIEEKGERVGLNEGRRLISYYIAGIRARAAARDAIHRAEDRDTVERILRQLEEESERDKG